MVAHKQLRLQFYIYDLTPVRSVVKWKTKVLACINKDGNPCAILLEIKIGVANIKNTSEEPQILKLDVVEYPFPLYRIYATVIGLIKSYMANS